MLSIRPIFEFSGFNFDIFVSVLNYRFVEFGFNYLVFGLMISRLKS